MKVFKYILLTFVIGSLVACSGNGINVTAEFDNTQDIKEGTKVFFDGKKIGEVSDVVKRDNGSIVELELNANTVQLLGSNSAVVVNRLKSGAPLELYGRAAENDEMIQDGQKIEGLDSMFQLGAWMVGDVIDAGTGSISKYVGAFQKYLGSDEFEDNKAVVQEQLTDLTETATAVVKDMEQEVTSAINELSINEEKIAETIEQLGDELSPVVGEVARNGSQLVQQLEKFIANIEENVDLSEQQSGEKIIESLAETFEKLNKSIEEGAEQGLSEAQ